MDAYGAHQPWADQRSMHATLQSQTFRCASGMVKASNRQRTGGACNGSSASLSDWFYEGWILLQARDTGVIISGARRRRCDASASRCPSRADGIHPKCSVNCRSALLLSRIPASPRREVARSASRSRYNPRSVSMSSADRAGWADVADELAEALVRLRVEDAICLDAGDAFVQFIRFGHRFGNDPAVAMITTAGVPGSRTAADLAALGWVRPDSGGTIGQPEVSPPVEPATARRLAEVIVRTLRDVHGAAGPAEVTFSSFNGDGLRAPRLRTIAAGTEQAAEDLDPATLLPEPSPT
jgi:hypothetical protein